MRRVRPAAEMDDRERLGSLLESYDAALAELESWGDPTLNELVLRLEVWRAATALELEFLAARATAHATA